MLRLSGSVAGHDGVVLDRLAADPGGVVLEPAVVAERAGGVEVLVVIERADVDQHGPHCLGVLDVAVHHRALQGDVAG